ncbi:hypothetical protein EDD22DRAFT_921481, partial [Suillus occidentalis]
MDWDVGPSPSQFSSSSQWARASTRTASADMSIDEDVGYVIWKQSQPDPVIRELMHNIENKKEKKQEPKPRLDASAHMSTWASSSSMAIPHRTSSLPGFTAPSTAPSTNTLPLTFVSNSTRKLHPTKLISKKIPPSRAYSATPPVKDDVPPDPELAAGYLHIIRNGTAQMDENSRRKQAARAKAEKEAASGAPGVIATQRNTLASSSGSRSTSTTLNARPLKKTASITSASSSALSRSLSSATLKPTASQSRYATTQSPYAATQATGQKPVTLPPFKPPLLKKPNPKPIPTPKVVVQTPESPPTSTPELDKDDSNDDGEEEDKLGAVGADSSFDVSFDVDADALEATMRQY